MKNGFPSVKGKMVSRNSLLTGEFKLRIVRSIASTSSWTHALECEFRAKTFAVQLREKMRQLGSGFLVSIGDEQKNWLRRNPASQQEQEFEAGRITPMQVFDDEDQRVLLCKPVMVWARAWKSCRFSCLGSESGLGVRWGR